MDRFEKGRDDEEKILSDKVAFAISYDGETGQRRVVAAGRGRIARRIEDAAREKEIEVKHDPTMTDALAQIGKVKAIPPQTYGVVAELLTFVYKLNDTFTGEIGETILPPGEEQSEES